MTKFYEQFDYEALMQLDKTILANLIVDQNQRLAKAKEEWIKLRRLLNAKSEP